jgi:hypothetical protein
LLEVCVKLTAVGWLECAAWEIDWTT